jgi:hypothetical protein
MEPVTRVEERLTLYTQCSIAVRENLCVQTTLTRYRDRCLEAAHQGQSLIIFDKDNKTEGSITNSTLELLRRELPVHTETPHQIGFRLI